MNILKNRADTVKKSFPRFRPIYSVKANPHPDILRCLKQKGFGIDAASANEVLRAIDTGFSSGDIYYSAPGKDLDDIGKTWEKCVIIADSPNELSLLDKFAAAKNCVLDIGVRLNVRNPVMLLSKHEVMGGGASKFGIGSDEFGGIAADRYKNLRITGIHIYFGSQISDVDIIRGNFKIIAETAKLLAGKHPIGFINFGGGFGVPYADGEREIDLKRLSGMIGSIPEIMELSLSGVRLNLELGRYVAAGCGIYVTKVADVKQSFGTAYIILKGGMNSFFRPVLTGDRHGIVQIPKRKGKATVTLVGNLCTPIDEYYSDIGLFLPEPGDLMIFENAGAYGYSMCLLDFISHDRPKEIIIS